ncbi:MAG: hypothetical protein L0287_08000 [Anaerolineae bacterium]|nr:hypothetical protein [Anaerolineae bacterium]
MSTNNSARNDYEHALGAAHHDSPTNQEDDYEFSWQCIALLIIALAMTIYGGVQFFIRM